MCRCRPNRKRVACIQRAASSFFFSFFFFLCLNIRLSENEKNTPFVRHYRHSLLYIALWNRTRTSSVFRMSLPFPWNQGLLDKKKYIYKNILHVVWVFLIFLLLLNFVFLLLIENNDLDTFISARPANVACTYRMIWARGRGQHQSTKKHLELNWWCINVVQRMNR